MPEAEDDARRPDLITANLARLQALQESSLRRTHDVDRRIKALEREELGPGQKLPHNRC